MIYDLVAEDQVMDEDVQDSEWCCIQLELRTKRASHAIQRWAQVRDSSPA